VKTFFVGAVFLTQKAIDLPGHALDKVEPKSGFNFQGSHPEASFWGSKGSMPLYAAMEMYSAQVLFLL
jgi:hypothetical protein